VPWSRWIPRASVVDQSRFQGPDGPFPGHWRADPAAWPEGVGADPEARGHLRDALDGLPDLWRAVVEARDVHHRSPEEVAEQLDLTVSQEQQVLTQARAALREELARFVARGSAP
jgi:RNA polymerase sigma-70 factor, ECF subfamily